MGVVELRHTQVLATMSWPLVTNRCLPRTMDLAQIISSRPWAKTQISYC